MPTIIDDRTPNLNLSLPAAGNRLSDDVERLRSSLVTIDGAVAAKAPSSTVAALDTRVTAVETTAATATVVGRTRFATSAEAVAGTSSTVAVTPAGTADAMSSATAINVATIAALRALTAPHAVVYVKGYYSLGDGGEGHFYLDTADTASSDNGGTIIVTTGGRRYKRVTSGSQYNVQWFGAKVDGNPAATTEAAAGTDDGAAVEATFAAAEAAGKGVFIPGVCRIHSREICIRKSMKVSGIGTGGGYSDNPTESQNPLTKYNMRSGLLFTGSGTQLVRTRRLYRASSSDAQDPALSVGLNVQAEFVNLCDFAVYLWFDRTNTGLSTAAQIAVNYGSNYDVGIFVGCRVHFVAERVHSVGYWRQACFYFDGTHATNMPRFSGSRTLTLTHGALNSQDPLPDTSVLSIQSVTQGGTTYVQGTDYRLTSGKVDWSLAGAEPAVNSAYTVKYTATFEDNLNNISGSDGCTMLKCFAFGGKWGVRIAGAEPKSGTTGIHATGAETYYDQILGYAVSDFRGTFGMSDFTAIACSFYGTDHHSSWRRNDITTSTIANNGTTVKDFVSDTAGGCFWINGSNGDSVSDVIHHMQFFSCRFASFEPYKLRLGRCENITLVGCHFESRRNTRYTTNGTIIDWGLGNAVTYGPITMEQYVTSCVIIAMSGTFVRDHVSDSAKFVNFLDTGAPLQDGAAIVDTGIYIDSSTGPCVLNGTGSNAGELDIRSSSGSNIRLRNGTTTAATIGQTQAFFSAGTVRVLDSSSGPALYADNATDGSLDANGAWRIRVDGTPYLKVDATETYCSSAQLRVTTGVVRVGGVSGPIIKSGTGSPEGVVTAPPSSLFLRTDGTSATNVFYVKGTGTGNTGWVAK